jgi:hypothetical protein
MKPFALRVLVVRYVVPLDEILGRKTDILAKIVPVSQTSRRPVTLLELNQFVARLQSLLPGPKGSKATIRPPAETVSHVEKPIKANKTKARPPAHSEKKPRKSARPPRKKP